MANPFMVGKGHEEIETAIIYDKARIYDIGNAVAYTDGDRIFVNTEDNLVRILPDYNLGFLKWILWHEQYHINLRHHNRFFKYLYELSAKETTDKFKVTKDEANIIMDILVHDSLSKLFPELIETAVNNLAQMRNRNSLQYTFKTFNLEDMLDEYSKFKHDNKDDGEEGTGESEEKESTEERKDSEREGTGDKKSDDEKKKDSDKGDSKKKTGDGEKKEDKSKKGHSEGGKSTPPEEDKKSKAEDGKPEEKDGVERPDTVDPEPPSEHDKTDWSKLDKIDSKEFIEKAEADRYDNEINRLRRKKLKMGRLTRQLNGLASTKRDRTYRLPSMLQTSDGCIFKGKTAGRIELYLIFDASGSMSGEMQIFKDIISRSVPQAMNCPCEWFAGYNEKVESYKREDGNGYFNAKFKDFMPVLATAGYCDDGDRVIELCYLAEQKGYSPIGVTDGGGTLSWSKDKLKQLKRTVLVGQNSPWLAKCKEVNPRIQTLDVDI